MSVAMALFELLQLFLIFLDHPRIEYLWHVPIMPPINQKGIIACCVEILAGSFSAARCLAANVDGGASLGISLGFSQHLAGDRGGIAFSEQDVAEKVDDGVALRPA